MPDMDMRRMQEEAARRAREMQSRARPGKPASQRPGPSPSGKATPPPSPAEPPPAAAPPPLPESVQEEGALPASLLEALFQDRERTVLLALLILLGAEGDNNELMFALLFLLM